VALAGSGLAATTLQDLFPPGDLRVRQEELSSTSIRLLIDNVDTVSRAKTNRSVTHTFAIAGAPGRPPVVSVIEAKYARYYQGRRVEERNDAPPASENSSTTSPVVRVADVGIFRFLQVYSLNLSVSIAAPESGQDNLWILEHLALDVNLGPAPKETADVLPELLRRERDFAKAQVLNYNIDPRYWIAAASVDLAPVKDWVNVVQGGLSAGPVFRVTISKPGIYRLRAEELQKGSERNALRPTADWRVYYRGAEVALVENDQYDDELVLIVPPDGNAEPTQKVYWVLTGGGTGKPRRLIPGRLSTTDASTTSTVVFEATATGYSDYHAKLRPTVHGSRWFWKALADGKAEEFPAPLPSWFAPQGDVQLGLGYGMASYATVLPSMRTFVNGHDLGETSTTIQQGLETYQIPGSYFFSGDNQVGLRIKYPPSLPPHDMMVQKLVLTWSQDLSSSCIGLRFKTPGQDGATSSAGLLLTKKDAGGPPMLVAYTAGEPRLLFPQETATEQWLYSVGPGATELELFNGRALPLDDVEEVSEFKGMPKTPADLVMVSDPTLTATLQPLIQRREATGLAVSSWTTVDVFDLFNYGERDGGAIHKLLLHLMGMDSPVKPLYLLLVGESSDFRGAPSLLPPRAQADMVPTIGGPVGEGMHGDHGYGLLTGKDLLQDIAVGRLPVRTPKELGEVIAKIEAYEKMPPGPWALKSEFALDDNEEFPTAAEQVVARAQAPPALSNIFRQSDYPYNINMRVTFRRRSVEATKRLLELWNEGLGTLTFFGHGGPNLWSHERLFHIQDVPSLANGSRLPLITCASCDNAWIDYPVAPVNVSIAELLVKHPKGGAIGVFGPVAGASPFEHTVLVARLMEAIYRKDIRRQGDAILYSKNMYLTENRTPAVPEQYLLLGDPTLSLNLPTAAVLDLQTTSVLAGAATAIPVAGFDHAGLEVPEIALQNVGEEGALTTATLAGGSIHLPPLVAGDYQVMAFHGNPVQVAAARLRVKDGVASPGIASPRVRLLERATTLPLSQINLAAAEPFTATGDLISSETPILRFQVDNDSEEIAGTFVAQLSREGTSFSPEIPVTALQPGERTRINIPCEAPLPKGTMDLELVLKETSSTQRYSVEAEVKEASNLHFVPGSARAWNARGRFVQRETVYLAARLKNSGGSVARNIGLQALIGSAENGTEAITINEAKQEQLKDFAPGEEREVLFRWENADNAGEYQVHLVVNKMTTVRESTFDDNSIAMPLIKIQQVRNLSVQKLEVSPNVAAVDEPLELRMAFGDDSNTTAGPVLIEYGLKNTLTGATSNTQETLPYVDNDQLLTRSLRFAQGFNHVYATVNADREIEELSWNDATSNLPISTIIDSAALPKENFSFSLKPLFTQGNIANMDVIGTSSLVMKDTFTSSAVSLPLLADYVTSGLITNTPADAGRDNQWSVSHGALMAWAGENAGEIVYKIPVTTTAVSENWQYDVYATVAAGMENGTPLGQFKLKLEDGAWSSFDFSTGNGGPMRDVLLGTAYLRNGALDFSIGHVPDASVRILSIQLHPQVSTWTSPIISISGPVSRVDGVGINLADNLSLETRTGMRNATGVAWYAWQHWSDEQPGSSVSGNLFQVRATLQKSKQIPVLQDIRITTR